MDTAPLILPPTNDWIFKLLFGDERHKGNTIALLKSFLNLPEVEIQVNPFPELGKRISFYKSKLVVGQIGEGEGYDVIRRVICVCILDYRLFPGTAEYLNRFLFYNPENGLCFEEIPEEIYTMELLKDLCRNNMTYWSCYFVIA